MLLISDIPRWLGLVKGDSNKSGGTFENNVLNRCLNKNEHATRGPGAQQTRSVYSPLDYDFCHGSNK